MSIADAVVDIFFSLACCGDEGLKVLKLIDLFENFHVEDNRLSFSWKETSSQMLCLIGVNLHANH